MTVSTDNKEFCITKGMSESFEVTVFDGGDALFVTETGRSGSQYTSFWLSAEQFKEFKDWINSQ